MTLNANSQSLSNDRAVDSQTFIKNIKAAYQSGLEEIKSAFLAKPNNKTLFKSHTKLVDGLLTQLWQYCHLDQSCCLIAVGGYGRAELYPYSDLDLLILLPETLSDNPDVHAKIEQMVGLFWDTGLNVGHSVRTIAECESEAKSDITIQTNLIECRLITGTDTLFGDYIEAVGQCLQVEAFIKAKVLEQNQRYAKYNDTAYNLEPNIKESPGGLRDIHSILWMTRSYLIGQAANAQNGPSLNKLFKQQDSLVWSWLKEQQLVSATELRHLLNHQRILQTIRIYLHFVSNRREDRLLFDFQNDVAIIMGFEKSAHKRASEDLMQRYFRSVKSVQVMNEILIKTIQDFTNIAPPILNDINTRFYTHNKQLHTKVGNLFQQQPESILEAFLLLQRNDVSGMSATLLRQLLRVRKVVNRDFIQSPKNKARFIEILSQPKGVSDSLRAMNRYGVLGAYIPAFGKIVGQMQHDLFHVYTVDEHTLHVLTNLHRFSDETHEHEFPLCSTVFKTFDQPYLLYLGALFHDIAKGRNGDHSELGKVDARRFCQQHGLNKKDTDLVSWMVEAHLKMSSTAQKSDLSDPKVIDGFAKYVKTDRRLIALYLLTVADIRGTSPKVWNAWKARLLESLFVATRHALKDKQQYIENVIRIRRQEATDKLLKIGLKPASFERLWEQFGDGYFERHKSDEVAWQSRLLTPHLHTKDPIVRSRLSPNGDGIQVMIYEKVQNDIFARICNFFDRMGYSIAEAKIFTTDHHYALDTFIVLDQNNKSVSYEGLNQYIETELTKKLSDDSPLEAPLSGRVSRQVKHVDYETQIEVTELADNLHQFDIITADKPGLLAKVAMIFIEHNIAVHNAKINTMGNRAEDSFIISDKKNKQLSHQLIKQLKETISTSL